MIRLGILGPSGRMGGAVLHEVADSTEFEVTALIDAPGSSFVGQKLAGITVTSDLKKGLSQCQVYVDFTSPTGTLLAAQAAKAVGCAAVIGTTALTAEAEAAIDALAKVAPVVLSPNFSPGVNVLLGLAERAARALDASFDLRVLDIHHKKKVDAPSGTAIALATAMARGRGVSSDGVDIASLRGGGVIGEHTAYFFAEEEQLEFTHRAGSRTVFASGAVRAASWAARQKPGRYGMREVLGL